MRYAGYADPLPPSSAPDQLRYAGYGAAAYFSIGAGASDTLYLDTLYLVAPVADIFVVQTGDATGQPSGGMNVNSGNSDVATGEAYIYSGSSAVTGDSGSAGVFSGAVANGTSGTTALWTGDATGGGNSGNVEINTGNSSIAASGDIKLTGGAGYTSAGSVIAVAGSVAGGGTGNGGDISLTPGTGAGAGRNGLVILAGLPTTAPAVSGAVWRDAGAANVLKVVP